MCVGERETPMTGSGSAAGAGDMSSTRPVSVGVMWSGIYYVTADGRLSLCGELNDGEDNVVQTAQTHDQFVQVSSALLSAVCHCHSSSRS